jgi:SSS family solute:Na+ symporter
MSIGAANTFTRNVWKPFVHPGMSPGEESFLAKLASLIVKLGALVVILFIPTKFAIDFQLLGGVWMIQCFPAIIFGLYTRWFRGSALLVGWAVGMMVGTYLAWAPTAWVPVHPVFG